MSRYFIFLSFKGTIYHGWQIQPNSVTVQKIINEALTLIIGENISTTGAGRTDAGVHARVFCAHFDSIAADLDSRQDLIFRLNRFLPNDISVTSIRKVLPDANARFDAISRTYKYYVSLWKDPFKKDSSWYIHGNLDLKIMNMASDMLIRHKDFKSFSRLHTNNSTNFCKIYQAGWEPVENGLVFLIKADRFLRNMVRAIVGTMIELGKLKISLEEFERIILAGNRSEAGISAPSKGLFLEDIEYPAGIFL